MCRQKEQCLRSVDAFIQYDIHLIGVYKDENKGEKRN